MSKQGQRNTERKRQLQAVRAQQHHADQRRRLIVAAGSTVAVLLVGGAVWAGVASTGPTAKASSSTASSSATIPGLQTYTGLARDHVTGETAVHSLEHGALWITYQPDLPAAQLATLKADAAGQPYALVSPYPGLPSPVVATVWGAQLKLDSAADPRLTTFIDTYASAAQAPEPRGECTGGTGAPTG